MGVHKLIKEFTNNLVVELDKIEDREADRERKFCVDICRAEERCAISETARIIAKRIGDTIAERGEL